MRFRRADLNDIETLAEIRKKQLQDEARERGLTKLVLHASKMGRIAYAKSGFEETDTVMEKTISTT